MLIAERVRREINTHEEEVDVANALQRSALFAHWHGLYGNRQPRAADKQLRKPSRFPLLSSSKAYKYKLKRRSKMSEGHPVLQDGSG